ncbi:MAG: DegT/DnrJ/EryC1/StrS family aminotransferase [Anaerolineales bacterium]|jgi:dTDP-4-amino-4,6-dideoxygalactose transaminase
MIDGNPMPGDSISGDQSQTGIHQGELLEIPFIDLTRQYAKYRYEIKMAIDRVLKSGIYASGEEAARFEQDFAEYYGIANCISVSSGLRALEVGLGSLGIGPGDEVITVANAGMHSTEAIQAIGAMPKFAEIDPISLTMSPDGLLQVITPKTRAVVITHLYGRVADIESILEITASNKLPLVEDCFQANGASLNGKRVGTWGEVGCFCFAPAKNLGALGEAGAVITGDTRLAENARQYRQNGDHLPWKSDLAWSKSRFMDELQAAILRVKLPMLEEWNLQRRMIAQTYTICFDELAGVLSCPNQVNGSVFQHYVIRTAHRQQLQRKLFEKGIGTTVHYPVADTYYISQGQVEDTLQVLTQTEQACSQVLSLPCYPELNPWEIEHVCGMVRQSLVEIAN